MKSTWPHCSDVISPGSPARDVGKRDQIAVLLGQMRPHALELLGLEESRAGRAFPEPWDMRGVQELATLDRQREHAPHMGEFPVDGAVRRVFRLTVGDIRSHIDCVE
jgi:hypothetical protein